MRDWATASTSESALLTGAWYDTPANHKLWAEPATGLRRGDHFSFSVDIAESTVYFVGETNAVDRAPPVPAVFVQDISDHSSMDGLKKLELVAYDGKIDY